MTAHDNGYPSPRIDDSRRLTGPNLYSVHPGAVLEVIGDPDELRPVIARWTSTVSDIFAKLGLGLAETALRMGTAGTSLFVAAPVDVLLTATEISEQAWAFAESDRDAVDPSVISRLGVLAAEERRTRAHLVDAFGAAIERGLHATFDDELLTIGSGAGSMSWPLGDVPSIRDIPWEGLRDVPIALVTGSNGKTTTTRLLAAMWRAMGCTAGWSCSDGVWVQDEQLEAGDFSGPAGARAVLRDKRVEAAVLETARGGMLRRGLATSRSDVAIITNVSADHFGEYGVTSLDELAEVKSIVARPLGEQGVLVLNAGDPRLVALAETLHSRIAWFAAQGHLELGGSSAIIEGGNVILRHGGERYDVGDAHHMPLTLGGAAPHNVENILGASLMALLGGVTVEAIRETLARFGESPDDNPGRLQTYRYGGVTALVDYAHNPGGLAVLCETARSFPASRRLLLLGQAGNRDDEQLRELARAAVGVLEFDHVIIKELPTMLRGREPHQVPRVLASALRASGHSDDKMQIIEGEALAVRRAFEWARDGDVLVLPVHVDKKAVLGMLSAMTAQHWIPGAPIPDSFQP